MKVLHVTAYFAPAYCYGGPPRSIYNLCSELIDCGIEVDVLTSTANGEGELDKSIICEKEYMGVPVTYLSRARPKAYFYCPNMASLLEEKIQGYDLVHIHGCWNYMSWLAGYYCRKKNIPYLVSPRGMLEVNAMKISSLKKKVAY